MMRRMFRPVKMILVATVTAALVAGLTLGMPVMAHAEPGTETQQAASVENQAVQPGDATRATALQAAADETGGEFYVAHAQGLVSCVPVHACQEVIGG